MAWVFVGRSGHTAGVPVPGVELMLRRFLENTMYARPRRRKRVHYWSPCINVGYICILTQMATVIHFLLTLAGVIGIASMVETFCHLRTPVFMSIMRGYDGLLIGALLGLLLIIAVRFMMYATQWFPSLGR